MPAFHALVRHPEFRRGAHEMGGVMLGVSAWGLVTGVAMVKGGLSVPLAIFMSLVVFAGSSQLAAVPLMAVGAPMWVVWATAFCVNLRFVIFSAQWRPYLMHLPRRWRLLLGYFAADLTYVIFMKRFPSPEQAGRQNEYLLGAISVNWLGWQIPALTGIVLADVIPTSWGLGFAGVLALLGLTCSMLSDRATWLSAAVTAGAAVAAFALPLRLYIVVAIAAGVCAGLIAEGLSPPAHGEPRRVR